MRKLFPVKAFIHKEPLTVSNEPPRNYFVFSQGLRLALSLLRKTDLKSQLIIFQEKPENHFFSFLISSIVS